jgi:hypothetical protein
MYNCHSPLDETIIAKWDRVWYDALFPGLMVGLPRTQAFLSVVKASISPHALELSSPALVHVQSHKLVSQACWMYCITTM